jgi:hypothetical protein
MHRLVRSAAFLNVPLRKRAGFDGSKLGAAPMRVFPAPAVVLTALAVSLPALRVPDERSSQLISRSELISKIVIDLADHSWDEVVGIRITAFVHLTARRTQ